MFRAEAFNTIISPIFSEDFNPNCNVEVVSNKDGKKERKRVDNISILTMPYCESLITLALVKVSAYKENRQINLKKDLLKAIELKQKPGRGKKKEPLTEADLLMSTTIPGQIQAKERKIKIFKEYETILNGIIREYEMSFLQEARK